MMRRWARAAAKRLFLVGLLVLGAGIVISAILPRPLASQWLEEQTGHTELASQLKGLARRIMHRPVETRDLVPVSNTSVPFLGASTFFEQEVEESKVRRTMELMRDAGIHWIRQEFPWDRIEWNGKGQFTGPYGDTWAHYDRIVALAEEYGLEIVARPDFPPFWSRRDNSVVRAPPDNFADYGDFIAALVKRYAGRIKYYQIWNEPNLDYEWRGTPNPAEYVELLRIAHQQAKAADPDVIILSAALSPTLGTPDGMNVSDLDYLQDMYDAGASQYFDILSAQGYGLWTGPGDRRADASQVNMSRVQLLREIMVRNGDQHKAIWISEFGWDALPIGFPIEAIHGRVTEEQQVRYTRKGLERIRDEWPWVGAVMLWHFRMITEEARQREDFYFRLVDPDFTVRPVYDAVRNVGHARPVLRYGWRQEDDPAISYSAGWITGGGGGAFSPARLEDLPPGYPNGYRATDRPGAGLAFGFVGSDLTLVTARGPQGGVISVTIDGGPPLDIDLKAIDPEFEVKVPLATGLSDGHHSVVMTLVEPGNAVIDGFIVTARRGSMLQTLAGVGLVVGAIGALGVVVLFGWPGR